jgi:hypothetical protein
MSEDIKSLRSWAKNRCIKATMEVNAVKKKKVDRALAL